MGAEKMSRTNQTIQTRLPEFDLLRSLAIIGVVIIHITAPLDLYAHQGVFVYYLFVSIHLAQRFCVPVFLIISGFFLTYKIENQQNPTLILKKRLLRIIPPYLFWSSFFYFLDVVLGERNFNLFLLLKDLLTGSVVGSYYFVVLIIQFYVLWWLLSKLKVWNYTKLLMISLGIQIIITSYLYYYLFQVHYFPVIDLMYRFIAAWSFYFVLGLCLGNNYEKIKRIIQKLKFPLVLMNLVFLVLSIIEFYIIDGLNLVNTINPQTEITGAKLETAISYWRISSQLYSVAFFLLIISFHSTNFLPSGVTQIVKKISEYSFAIYLIHQPILWKLFFRVFNLLGTGSLASFLVILVLDLGICYGLIYLGCKFLPKKYSRYVFGL
ncbi:acyltransferase [Allocoleopsis franciscana]|nr:acyltransferase [Allocoleopsis franciscana]